MTRVRSGVSGGGATGRLLLAAALLAAPARLHADTLEQLKKLGSAQGADALPGEIAVQTLAAEPGGGAGGAGGAPPSSEIKETDHYADAAKAAEPETLFITDLDNTVMEPVQDLGSDQWYVHYFAKKLRETPNKDEALRQALEVGYKVTEATEMKLTESDAPAVLRGLQKAGVRVMALTMRRLPIADRTVRQLSDLNVDFRLSPPYPRKFELESLSPAVYDRGILFGNGISKKLLLVEFLRSLGRMTGYRPRKIVFVDDRESNVRDVQAAAGELGIAFVGFRYGQDDAKVKNFDPGPSDFELECFQKTNRIVSDDQARRRRCPGP